MNHRVDETDTTHFRSDRIFTVNGSWFSSTREHLELGPFPSRNEAEVQVLLFISESKNSTSTQIMRERLKDNDH